MLLYTESKRERDTFRSLSPLGSAQTDLALPAIGLLQLKQKRPLLVGGEGGDLAALITLDVFSRSVK